LGLLVALVGVRGRRRGDHEHCRRCGFDLSGRPEGAAACPECGADLSRRRATVKGVRHRRPWVTAAGVLLVLLGLSGAGFWSARSEWTDKKPVFWLRAEARAGSAATRDKALLELGRRLPLGMLSDAQVAAIVDDAIAVQPTAAWASSWGNLVEAARAARRVDDGRWATYARQGFAFTATVRPQVRQGEPVPFQVVAAGTKLAANTRLGLRVRIRTGKQRADGGADDAAPWRAVNFGRAARGVTPIATGLAPTPADAGPGTHEQVVVLEYEIVEGADAPNGPFPGGMREVSLASQKVLPGSATFKMPVTIVPSDRPAVAVVDAADAQVTDAVRKAITVAPIPSGTGITGYLHLQLSCDTLMTGVCHRMAVWDGERAIARGTVRWPKDTRAGTHVAVVPLQDLRSPTLRVTLTPDVVAAERTVDVLEMTGAAFTFEDVPTKAPPSTAPVTVENATTPGRRIRF
jgi:hypothetical protein